MNGYTITVNCNVLTLVGVFSTNSLLYTYNVHCCIILLVLSLCVVDHKVQKFPQMSPKPSVVALCLAFRCSCSFYNHIVYYVLCVIV